MDFNTSNNVKKHSIEYNKYFVSNIFILKNSLISSSLSPIFVKIQNIKLDWIFSYRWDNPANNIPYVANEDTANIYNIPK